MRTTSCVSVALCLLVSLGIGCNSSSKPSKDPEKAHAGAEKPDQKKPNTKKIPNKDTKKTSPKDTPEASKTAQQGTPFPWPASKNPPKRSGACSAGPAPSSASFGLKPKEAIACIESLLSNHKNFAKDIPTKFTFNPNGPQGTQQHSIPEFMDVLWTVDKEGNAVHADFFFYPTLREKHGVDSEIIAQHTVLAAMIPAAQGSTIHGHALFSSIRKRAEKDKTHSVRSLWNGIHLESSFMPVSVRYRFKLSQKK